MAIAKDFEIRLTHIRARDSGVATHFTPTLAYDIARAAKFIGRVQVERLRRAALGVEPRARISFYPRKPRSFYAIWPVCHLAGLKIVDDPQDADLLFYFRDAPWEAESLPAPVSNRAILNGDCLDIRKSTVARAFEHVFGYPLAIDPTTHNGLALAKSEGNGVHDGRIVQCPIRTPEEGMVYQRLIENTSDGRTYTDIRTPIIGGEIPLVYLKRRSREGRFSNDNKRVELTEPRSMLSETEIEKLGEMARLMNLDFGGVDVLRDRQDGRIYVVDVNKTDMGPPTALPGADKYRAMTKLAETFGRLIDRHLARRVH